MNHSISFFSGLRVLVVDRHWDSISLLQAILADYNIQVFPATCVDEALTLLQIFHPDLLISEICLPGEDGYSLMRKVKILEAESHFTVPAIALTVCTRPSDRREALAAGYCQHISKPFDIGYLMTVIAQIVEGYQKDYNLQQRRSRYYTALSLCRNVELSG